MTCYKAIINGRLTADPVLKTSDGGSEYVNFTVATDNRASKNEKKSATFRDAVAFGFTAKYICTTLKKGDGAIFIGREEDEEYSYVDREGTQRDGRKPKVFIETCDGNVAGRKWRGDEATVEPSRGDSIPI